MKAAVYVRLSRESRASSSIDRQRDDCERLAEERGFDYHPDRDLYVDDDMSAYDETRSRPAYERLVRKIGQGTYDVLIVWKVDRLYRRFDGLARIMAALSEQGTQLVSVTEANLDIGDPMGKAIVGFLGAQAEKESDNTSLRVRSAQERNRRQGFWHGGRYPYGYEGVRVAEGGREGTKLRVVPSQAETVREVARRILDGEALNAIVRDLNVRGVESPGRTDDWTYPGTKLLLENPTVAGYVASSNGNGSGERTIVYHDGEPVTVVVGEPVLDRDTWARVRDTINRQKGSRPDRRSRSLLAGLIRCAECGYAMGADNRDDHPVYRCGSRYERGTDVCPGNACSMNGVNDYVLGVAEGLLETVLAEGASASAEAEAERSGPLVDQLTHLATLEDQQEQELDRLVYDERRDYEDPAVVRHLKRMEETRDRRDDLQAELDRHRHGQTRTELRDLLGSDPVTTFGTFDVDRKRRVLSLLLERVEVSKADGPSAHGPTFDTDRVGPVPRTTT